MPDGMFMEQISFSDKSVFKNKNKHYVVIITDISLLLKTRKIIFTVQVFYKTSQNSSMSNYQYPLSSLNTWHDIFIPIRDNPFHCHLKRFSRRKFFIGGICLCHNLRVLPDGPVILMARIHFRR